MSAIRQSKVTGVAPETIMAGAKAMKLKTTSNTIQINGSTFTVTKEGGVRGDYDFITQVGKFNLPKLVEQRPKALVGILAQVGTAEKVAEKLLAQGFSVEKNSTSGAVVATKGNQRIDFNIDQEGIIRREGTNYEGNTCLSMLDTMLGEICSESVMSTEMKTQPTMVVRRAI